MSISFLLQVIQGCPFCDEAMAHFPAKLPKKYPDTEFRVKCLIGRDISSSETYPILSAFKVDGFGTKVEIIRGAMYKKDIDDFVDKFVKGDD